MSLLLRFQILQPRHALESGGEGGNTLRSEAIILEIQILKPRHALKDGGEGSEGSDTVHSAECKRDEIARRAAVEGDLERRQRLGLFDVRPKQAQVGHDAGVG